MDGSEIEYQHPCWGKFWRDADIALLPEQVMQIANVLADSLWRPTARKTGHVREEVAGRWRSITLTTFVSGAATENSIDKKLAGEILRHNQAIRGMQVSTRPAG